MFGWIKKLFGAKPSAPVVAVDAGKPVPKPIATAASLSAPVPKAAAAAPAPAANPTAANDTAPLSEKQSSLSRRQGKPEARKASTPLIGMPALMVAPGKVQQMTILSVQAAGRRVVAKAKGIERVVAFTRRPDHSYRLAGAPDRSATQLVLKSG